MVIILKYLCSYKNDNIEFSQDMEEYGLNYSTAKYKFFKLMIEKGIINIEENQKSKKYNSYFNKYIKVEKYDENNILCKNKKRKSIQITVKNKREFTKKDFNYINQNVFYKPYFKKDS